MAQDLLDRGSSLVITSHQQNALTDLCRKQWWIKEATLVESPLLQVITDKELQTNYASSNAN
jgi:tungstate transport system ATP-binding protein